MQDTVPFIVSICVGAAVLGWSADRFVSGASALARNYNVSPMIIGLTIVAFGTSAPEMLVSGIASWQGNSGIAIGNAIGSNIANIALVLGVAALIAPLTVQSQTLNREFPLMLLVMLFALALFWNGILSRLDALLLLTGMVVVVWTVHLAHRAPPADPMEMEILAKPPAAASAGRTGWLLFSGVVLLLVSSRLMVWGAVGIAQAFGVTDLVIGLTVIAIGTSLPELAATVVAARQGEHDIAVGNVVGSNMFNILAVLGISGMIDPGEFEMAVLTRDFPLMIALTLALYLMARGKRNSAYGSISRWEGGVLLAVFAGYQLWVFSVPQ